MTQKLSKSVRWACYRDDLKLQPPKHLILKKSAKLPLQCLATGGCMFRTLFNDIYTHFWYRSILSDTKRAGNLILLKTRKRKEKNCLMKIPTKISYNKKVDNSLRKAGSHMCVMSYAFVTLTLTIYETSKWL